MRTAVLGAGALGLISGALITRSGYDCTLIDINRDNIDAMNRSGVKIIGKYTAEVPVKAALPNDLGDAMFDLVLLQTKQMHMLEALAAIEKNLEANAVIVTLQNGIPENKVAEVYGKDKVIGGSVFHGAKYIGPGISELTTDYKCMHTYIGELDGQTTPRIQEIEKVLLSVGGVDITPDIFGVKWTKLIINTVLSGTSAAFGSTFGTILEDYRGMLCMACLASEGARVMEKKGYIPTDMEGFLPTVENYSFSNKAELAPVERRLRELISYSYDEVASMLQDIWAGRTVCEIDDLNGAIVQAGKEVGIPTPYNEKIVEIVKKILAGELKAEFSNIQYFELPSLKEL